MKIRQFNIRICQDGTRFITLRMTPHRLAWPGIPGLLRLLCLLTVFLLPVSGFADRTENNAESTENSFAGKWCLNGEPYTCYPPVEHHGNSHPCIENTVIHNVSAGSFDWIIKKNLHFYTGGFVNGEHESITQKLTFERTNNPNQYEYQNVEQTNHVTRIRKITVKKDRLEMQLKQIPKNPEISKLSQNLVYERCHTGEHEHGFYTALVDCGGTGDYIAGVPAVIDNALLWENGRDKSVIKACKVAAKCWGGGWVAVAYSRNEDNSAGTEGRAFGAACGGESRNTVIEQAIRSCQESGGSNCFATVISAFDSGVSYKTNTDKKGSKVQSCRNGNCKSVR